ncbi:MAG: hypothetical protein QOI63_75 [Thermoplasmata archaeon]|jgi:hypothetical protein|nr:hypothetical protein [Thermoplasmata archaeon]
MTKPRSTRPTRTPKTLALLLIAGLLVLPSANAATISSGGPLTDVWVSTDLSCQVAHVQDGTTTEFYPSSTEPGDCATFLVVGSTLYAPNFSAHSAGTATGGIGASTTFSAVSQTGVTGAGTAGSPFQVVTVVNVGTTGLQIRETDQYVVGDDFYHTDVAISNSGATATSAILYRAVDCYLGASDSGYGALALTAPGSIACTKNANNVPAGRVEELIPRTAGSAYYESDYNSVWTWIGGHTGFPNTCDCATNQDNGEGLSWDVVVPAHGSVTYSSDTRFSIPDDTHGPAEPDMCAEWVHLLVSGVLERHFDQCIGDSGAMPCTPDAANPNLGNGLYVFHCNYGGAVCDPHTVANRADLWNGQGAAYAKAEVYCAGLGPIAPVTDSTANPGTPGGLSNSGMKTTGSYECRLTFNVVANQFGQYDAQGYCQG